MSITRTVKPEVLAGFQDYLPERMIAWQSLIEKIRRVYESFGFLPLDTPCMERPDVLTGGQAFDKSVYVSRIVQGLEDRGQAVVEDIDSMLRFDLTVSLARVVAAYPKLSKPFKRYQIGKVWRGEKPQQGRFREFVQFDIDTIGSRSMLADTEIIQVMSAVMETLGIPDYLIKFNNRKILSALAEIVGCGGKVNDLCRVLDKVGDIGIDGVVKTLTSTETARAFEEKLILSTEQAEFVRQFLALQSDTPEGLLESVGSLFGGSSEVGTEGVTELKEISANLDALGVPRNRWQIDLSVARGLGYYTGPVFETSLTQSPEMGSVFSGGRFDGLTNRFMAGSNIAGVGASVGVDRLIATLEKRGALVSRKSTADVLVTVFNPTLVAASLQFAERLRKQGFNTELYVENTALGAQLGYARTQEIPFVVVIGPDEARDSVVALKNMATKTQKKLTEEACYATIRSSLASK